MYYTRSTIKRIWHILLMNIIKLFGNYYLWIVLLFLCFLIQFFQLEAVFRFDRPLIMQGEVWRLLSGHLTHLNWTHFLLNMAGVGMIAFFFSHYRPPRYWGIAIIFIAIMTSAGLLLDQQLDRYVGFSGVLHGLFIIGGRLEMTRYRLSGIVVLLVLVGKLMWEQFYGAMPGSEMMIDGRVAVNSHLLVCSDALQKAE